ncbi:hypothetical protein [Streptomyces sp. V4I2]|uniref:hypothetical protein n=1 Tax=Streptomyces sp. V4I2 TaxID=3042280 RepID=UPI00278273B4|nr:hypothetical protein [Streptomyces sp. V4I2]MDQ1051770.1 hypothetical protein [Streptomyces sp. V4I2]
MPSSSPAEPEQTTNRRDQPLTLARLRQLIRQDWAGLPGKTLVVLSGDSEGNRYSPFSTYSRSRYAPIYGLTGDVYPLESELAEDRELRELFPEIPDHAVAALVLYPLD